MTDAIYGSAQCTPRLFCFFFSRTSSPIGPPPPHTHPRRRCTCVYYTRDVSFQSAEFGFRFVDDYTAMPSRLLPQHQPQYLRPALDPSRMSFPRAGQFRPFASLPQLRPEGFAPAYTSELPNDDDRWSTARRRQRQQRQHGHRRSVRPADECSDAPGTEDVRGKYVPNAPVLCNLRFLSF